ncbi:hypothetical protein BDV19DRAFT_353766 [Aspergillus venezuelensis]
MRLFVAATLSLHASKVHCQYTDFLHSSTYPDPALNHGKTSQASFARSLGELSFLGCEISLVSSLRRPMAHLRLGVGWPRRLSLSVPSTSPFPISAVLEIGQTRRYGLSSK